MNAMAGVMHGGRTGAAIGAYGGPYGAAAGAIVGGLIGGAIGWWAGSQIVEQIDAANADAGALSDLNTDVRCATCDQNPCAQLAGGTPGAGPYRGGAHGAMRGPVGDGLDSHHTPARAASYLHPEVGPAIQMDPADHARTASNRVAGRAAYIAAQRQAVNSGNFLSAQAMDITDIRAKFGSKYDSAIAQMEAYTLCLRQNGIIR